MIGKRVLLVFSVFLVFLWASAAHGANGSPAGTKDRGLGLTVGGPGDPMLTYGGGPQSGNLIGPQLAQFGMDIHVRPKSVDYMEINQDMVSDADGNLYVIWEDTALSFNYLQLYKSTDGGKTWAAFGYLLNTSCHLKEPSLAVGMGKQNLLVIAYVIDDPGYTPAPQVATTPLDVFSSTIHVPPWMNAYESYAKPVVWTDHLSYSDWNIYLTYEGIMDSATNNVDVVYYRSNDFGLNWSSQIALFGGTDNNEWIDPDGAFGTNMDWVYLTCYNATTQTVTMVYSIDRGVTFKPAVDVAVYSYVPTFPVDPEIEAAVNHNNVMICCTKRSSDNTTDNIGFATSTNAGKSWSALKDLPNSMPDFPEFAAALTANEGGGSFHLAYNADQSAVYYNYCPQNLSGSWTYNNSLRALPDLTTASGSYPKKGIASIWSTDVAGVAWADFRGGYPDIDTYYDFTDNIGLAVDQYFIRSPLGGSVDFFLNAGADKGLRDYILLGTVTGTYPGIPLPGGMATLPVNWDVFTNVVLSLLNTPVFDNFMGKLDKYGRATAKFNMSPMPQPTPIYLYFAFAVASPWDFASNFVQVRIIP